MACNCSSPGSIMSSGESPATIGLGLPGPEAVAGTSVVFGGNMPCPPSGGMTGPGAAGIVIAGRALRFGSVTSGCSAAGVVTHGWAVAVVAPGGKMVVDSFTITFAGAGTLVPSAGTVTPGDGRAAAAEDSFVAGIGV